MQEKLLLLALLSIILVPVPALAAAESGSERIHVNGAYAYSPNRGFTLWFTNGTILSNHLNGYQIPVSDSANPTQWSFSFVATNDLNIPITITATTTNTVALPQNIVSTFTCKATNGQTVTTIAAGGRETLQLSGDFHTNGSYTQGAIFSYAIQVAVNSNATTAGSIFGVYGDAKYPTAPSPTPNSSASPQPTTTATASNSPAPSSTAQPTANPTGAPALPEFGWTGVVLALLVLLPAVAILFKRHSKTGSAKLKVPATVLTVALTLAGALINLPSNPWAEAQPPSPTIVSYSLWFVNGTAFPLNINSGTFEYGNMMLNIGGIMVSRSAYGSQYMPETNLIVLRNDGTSAITVNATLDNVNTPVNIKIWLQNQTLSSSWAPPNSQWMGQNNLATGKTVAPGECLWLGITLTLAQSTNAPSGTPTFDFTYSFDIVVNATQVQ